MLCAHTRERERERRRGETNSRVRQIEAKKSLKRRKGKND